MQKTLKSKTTKLVCRLSYNLEICHEFTLIYSNVTFRKYIFLFSNLSIQKMLKTQKHKKTITWLIFDLQP